MRRRAWMGSLLFTLGCAAAPAPSATGSVEIPAAPSVSAAEEPVEPPKPRPEKAAQAPVGHDPKRAEEAFMEGRKLMEEQRYTEACERFELSLRLDSALGTMLNLAMCNEKAGNNARACEVLAKASALAKSNGQTDRGAFADAKAKSLGCR